MSATAIIAMIVAVVSEVTATLSLRMAGVASKLWWVVVTIGYILAFAGLSIALAHGMPLGVAYGVWAAAGVALTAVASKFLFGEAFTPVMGIGIVLIIGGVLLIEVGAVDVA